MNALHVWLFRRFLKRNILLLRSSESQYGAYDRLPLKEIAKAVPRPEWWELDSARFQRLQGILPSTTMYAGILEWRDTYDFDSNTMDSVGTPGVFVQNVLGDDIPVHVVRCVEQSQDMLFIPLYRPLSREGS